MLGHNAALVRGNKDLAHNLAIGDPAIVRQHIEDWCIGTEEVRKHTTMASLTFNGYPEMKAKNALLNAIEDFGFKTGIYIIPTLGAKHALHAALYAVKKVHSLAEPLSFNPYEIRFPTPYWVSYPEIIMMQGLQPPNPFQVNYWFGKPFVVDIIASPNNPDGKHVDHSDADVVIWDAAYASKIYGSNPVQPLKSDISIWSGGKLTGLVNERVGWLSTDNYHYSIMAAHYVEMTTSGVSSVAQYFVADAMRFLYESDPSPKSLRANFARNMDIICELPIEYSTHTEMYLENGNWYPRGMFLWMNIPEHERLEKALEASKIAVLRGAACGMKEPGWFRWSLGLSNDETRMAVQKLTKELKK